MTSQILVRFFQLVVALSLAACATVREYQGADFGNLVVSIAQPNDAGGFEPALFIRLKGSKNIVEVNREGARSNLGEFRSEDSRGVVRVLKLAPGTYEIFQFQYQYGGAASAFGQSTPYFPPFEFVVETGKVTYAGNYQLFMSITQPERTTTTKGITVVPTAAMAVNIALNNTKSRDMAKAAIIDPSLSGKPVRDDAPRGRPDLIFGMR
jgi:hypothetical protein